MQTMTDSERIAADYTRRGIDVVKATAHPNGYDVTTTNRAAAYAVARTVANEFEADQDAGDVTVEVREYIDGTYTTFVTWSR